MMIIIIILISITPPPPCQACWSPCSHPSASPSGLGLAAPPWSSLWLWSWRCWWGWWWCCCWQHDDCVDAIEKKTDLSNKSLLWLSTLWPRSSKAVSTLRIRMILRLIMMSMMIHLLIFPSSSFPKRSFEAALCLPILATWMIMRVMILRTVIGVDSIYVDDYFGDDGHLLLLLLHHLGHCLCLGVCNICSVHHKQSHAR